MSSHMSVIRAAPPSAVFFRSMSCLMHLCKIPSCSRSSFPNSPADNAQVKNKRAIQASWVDRVANDEMVVTSTYMSLQSSNFLTLKHIHSLSSLLYQVHHADAENEHNMSTVLIQQTSIQNGDKATEQTLESKKNYTLYGHASFKDVNSKYFENTLCNLQPHMIIYM